MDYAEFQAKKKQVRGFHPGAGKLQRFVAAIEPGSVVKFDATENKDVEVARTSIYTAAKSLGLKVETSIDRDEGVVWVARPPLDSVVE